MSPGIAKLVILHTTARLASLNLDLMTLMTVLDAIAHYQIVTAVKNFQTDAFTVCIHMLLIILLVFLAISICPIAVRAPQLRQHVQVAIRVCMP
jgi:ABC-type polysaccharide/polyol phosphate export permease